MLPFLQKITSFFHKAPKKEYFVVFLIESKYIKVAVWEKTENKINILKIVKEDFSGSFEDLIEISDRAISKASFGIPEEMIEKVIFSVPTSWSDSGKIQGNYLKILKNVCVALSLKPLGFVVTTDAIVQNIDKLEPNKINFLLFHLTPEIINLSFVEHGNVTETISSLRSANSIADDFLEVLSRFKVQIFPSKIIIFDGNLDLESAKQEILKTPLTQKEKRFLHFPSVEILPEDSDINSVVNMVGSEMGARIEKQGYKPTVSKKEELPVEKEETENIESLGFYYDKDVAEAIPAKVEEVQEETAQKTFTPPNVSLKTAAIILLGFCAAVFLIFVGFWFFFSKAEVTLHVKTSSFKDDVDVILSANKSSKSNYLQGQEVTATVESSKEVLTTGTKKTGDKATGEVTMFNKNSDSAKTFDKGAVITDGTLKFLLDNAVTVDPSTTDTQQGQETKIFGKATVKVTAEKFGSEYNSGDNKDWSVDGYAQSSYSAHNEREFSGGTTKQVQVVSQEDSDNLYKKLESELESKAKKNVASKIDEKSQDILDSFVDKKVIDKKFSNEVDEEAKNLTLDLKMSFTTYAYNKDDAKKILDKLLKTKIPSGYFIDQNSISLKINTAKATDNGYNLNFTYQARAIPKINISETAGKIKGVEVASLDKYLKSDNIESYDVNVWPTLPGIFKTMPHQENNIKIQLKY